MSWPTRRHHHGAGCVRLFKQACLFCWVSAGLLNLTGCSTPALPSQSQLPKPAHAAPPESQRANPLARADIVMSAMALLDTRYSWGGRGPATGFDCSGLVSHVFREGAGMDLRGSSADLGKRAKPIARSQLQPGDLVFFNTLGARHSHVGVYVGNDRFVHASNERTGVRIDPLSNRYYAQRFEGGGNLLD